MSASQATNFTNGTAVGKKAVHVKVRAPHRSGALFVTIAKLRSCNSGLDEGATDQSHDIECENACEECGCIICDSNKCTTIELWRKSKKLGRCL